MFPRQTADQTPDQTVNQTSLGVPKAAKYAALAFGLMAAALGICLAATEETRTAAAVTASQKPLPDLVVEQRISRSDTPDRREIETVTVRNQGSAPAGWVSLAVVFDERFAEVIAPPKGTDGWSCSTPTRNTSRRSKTRSFSSTCKPAAEIQPGESVTLRFEAVRKAGLDLNERLAVGAIVDIRDRVKESDESNNQVVGVTG